jgi:hypothetical protein
MTAKEKAEELVRRFTFQRDEHEMYVAKQCALIAVDELINSTLPSCEWCGIINNNTIEYWEEVKQEIEKL